MKIADTAKMIAIAAAIDNRRTSEAMAEAWHEVIGHLDYEDARRGLRLHRANHPGVYLEPGHILQALIAERARHRELYGIHPPAPAGKRWAANAIESDPKYGEIES
jgi:hypothetical protein